MPARQRVSLPDSVVHSLWPIARDPMTASLPPQPATTLAKPSPFLEVHVTVDEDTRRLTGLCAGYELRRWRAAHFARHAMEWLPEFALKLEECQAIGHANCVPMMRRAAKVVYDTKKFRKRGEFGELFLHIAVRQVFDSIPAISKIYYKSSTNETVKGFDAVHVVAVGSDLELWLGEAKFYRNFRTAAKRVAKELKQHLDTGFLRSEFILLTNKLDSATPYYARLKVLLSENTTLDKVFARLCIPVLITYDSDCLSKHDACSPTFIAAFEAELRENFNAFKSLDLPTVRVHLFLMPLNTKKDLVSALDENLKTWQKV